LKSGDIEANVTARFATYWQDGKKSWHSFRLRTGVHALPYPWGVSDPEQVEGAMPYDSEDGFPRFFRQGIRSGRLPCMAL
jgi:hypothetical protein